MLVVEHKTHEISGTRVKGKLIILELSLFASPAVGKTAIEMARFTTFVERATIWIIEPTEFSLARRVHWGQ